MMYPRPPKRKPDRAHLARVAELPCVICGRHPVQVHHCIHGRYSQRKADDRETIPLCREHHDELHAGKASWAEKYGPDHAFLRHVAWLLGE
jgi:hypothetical protein